MSQHDRYDNDILKVLQKIATSLDKIEKHMSVQEDLYRQANIAMEHYDPNDKVENHITLIKNKED